MYNHSFREADKGTKAKCYHKLHNSVILLQAAARITYNFSKSSKLNHSFMAL